MIGWGKNGSLAIVLVCLAMMLTLVASWAADAEKPHPHQGVLVPYEPTPLTVSLDVEQRENLADGKLVIMTIEEEDTGGTGIGVIDIAGYWNFHVNHAIHVGEQRQGKF